MCDEREPLLAYLYDDGDPAERRRMAAHLETCATCRAELSDLRAVRQDLLAWDVPDHGSVWTPFVPVRAAWSWRDVPAWAMAAAALVMLSAGAAGGALATAYVGNRPVVVTATRQAEPIRPAATAFNGPAAQPVALTGADLDRLQARLLAELDRRDHASADRVKAEHDELFNNILGVHQEFVTAKTATDKSVAGLSNKLGDLLTQMAQNQQGGR